MNLFEYTYDLVRQIPPGKVSTYGAVADALGDKIAARAVGWMMNQNPDADDMPCFKIVYSDGKLGGFGLGIEDKIRRLKDDNVVVRDGKIAGEFLWPIVPFIAIAVLMVIVVIFLVLMERKVLAWLTVRKGPNRVGPLGLLQTVADAIKLLCKEDIMPVDSNKILFKGSVGLL